MQTIINTAKVRVTLQYPRLNYGQVKDIMGSNKCLMCTIQTGDVCFAKVRCSIILFKPNS